MDLDKLTNEELKKLYNDKLTLYGELGTQYYKIEEQILSNRLEIDYILNEIKKRNINAE